MAWDDFAPIPVFEKLIPLNELAKRWIRLLANSEKFFWHMERKTVEVFTK